MRGRIIASALVLAGVFGTPAALVYGQADPGTQTEQRTAAADRNDGGEWGWMGLLGLAGLLGLKRRVRDDVGVRRAA